MIVVSDTSPVSNLILIERLEILHKLSGEIVIPPAVHNEISALKGLGKSIFSYETSDWITVTRPSNDRKVDSFRTRLDEGESQAIVLALEINCNLLLIDERLGTRFAREEGLKTVGLAGVLISAKHEGKSVKCGLF